MIKEYCCPDFKRAIDKYLIGYKEFDKEEKVLYLVETEIVGEDWWWDYNLIVKFCPFCGKPLKL